MSKEIKLIPELRFPEFEEQDGWVLNNVNSIFSLQDGYAFSSRIFTTKAENTSQVIRITDINNHNWNSEKVFIPKEKIADLGIDNYLVKRGDLLLSLTGAAGFNFYIWDSDDAYINQRTMKITPKDSKNESLKILLSPLIHKIINGIGTGQNNNLSKDALKEVELPIPKPQEQQKIASCLSSLDELIAAHNDKLDSLKDHKKGLMQSLFPQEGETVPKIRFNEFEDDGEWEKKELGDLVTIKGRIGYRGYTKEDIVSKGEGAISMSPSNISAQGALSFEKSTYITWDKYYESPEIMLENGFTVLVKTGSTFGKVAFISNLVEKATINPQLVVLKPEDVNNFFLYLIVSNTAVQTQITATVVGGAIPTLSQDSISKFEVMIPKEKEQKKIASCLSAVDELITAQADKVEQLQQHKKGLMQGLFPNPSASSGETIES